MARPGVDALIVSDPINIRYAVGARDMQVFSMGNAPGLLPAADGGPLNPLRVHRLPCIPRRTWRPSTRSTQLGPPASLGTTVDGGDVRACSDGCSVALFPVPDCLGLRAIC